MSEPRPPRYLKPMNKVMMAVQKLGIPTGPAMVLTVPGRKSGRPRSTPMTPFEFRAASTWWPAIPAPTGRRTPAPRARHLARGRRSRRVRIVELTAEKPARCYGRFRAKCRSAWRSRSDRGWCATGPPTNSRHWRAGWPSSDSIRRRDRQMKQREKSLIYRAVTAPAGSPMAGRAVKTKPCTVPDCHRVADPSKQRPGWQRGQADLAVSRTGYPLRSARERSWPSANVRGRPASGITTPAHSPSAPGDSTASRAHMPPARAGPAQRLGLGIRAPSSNGRGPGCMRPAESCRELLRSYRYVPPESVAVLRVMVGTL